MTADVKVKCEMDEVERVTRHFIDIAEKFPEHSGYGFGERDMVFEGISKDVVERIKRQDIGLSFTVILLNEEGQFLNKEEEFKFSAWLGI